VHEDKLDEAVPRLVFPDARNRIVETRSVPAGPQAGDPDIVPLGAAL
jgi:aspartate 1-decarboxylase